jgi:hypothetical protein
MSPITAFCVIWTSIMLTLVVALEISEWRRKR